MAVSGTRISVTSVATLIYRGDSNGTSVVVRNADTVNAIDVGGAAVTSGGGFSLLAGASVSADMFPGEEIYGIAAPATTVVVHVLAAHEGA